MVGATALYRKFVSVVAAVVVAMTIGCGGNATNRAVSSTPGPANPTATPSPTATPTPSPTPSPTPTTPTAAPTTPTPPPPTPTPTTTPTPTPSPSSPQYQVTLFSGTTAHGQVTVDNTGLVTVQVSGGTVSTQYAVQFCAFPSTRYHCVAVGTVNSDGTGSGQTTFHFPNPGAWAGDFEVTANGVTFSTQVASNVGQPFFATLQPASTANAQGSGNSPSSSATLQDRGAGTVTANGNNVHVVLNGATPNTQYVVVQCFPSAGSGCFQLGPFNANTFTTDGNGNALFDVPTQGIPGDFFMVEQAVSTPSTPLGLVAGFRVP